ncbi:MAG: zinc ribbon domain-containing protein [Caldilineaceae bacterium]|nr:zinc ribbon domain-containing protein [Caldilineaceae bacterium]
MLEQRMVQRGEMQYCPYCAELIKAEAIKCRYCGEGFGGDQSSPQSLYMR